MKIQLEQKEAIENANTDDLARVLLARFGLLPRKKDGNAKIIRERETYDDLLKGQ